MLYQNEKLRRLIDHVYHNVPYYRDVMRNKGIEPHDIKSSEDLNYFPILTKDIIRVNFQNIIFNGMNNRSTIKRTTSGTTGKRLILFRDRNSRIWEHAALLRGWSWAQYNIGDTVINFITQDTRSIWGKILSRLINSYYFAALVKRDQILECSRKIKSLHPFCLTGFTSSLYLNSSLYEKHNVTGIRIPVIFTCGEMLHDYQRNLMEKNLNGKVYDFYGSNEIGSVAYECEHNNKHITDEHVIIETVNSQGANVSNTCGDIILTDLDNYAMPFIRYKIGDVGTLTDKKCECGRGLRVLKSLDGRSQEFLKTLDGNYIPGIYFPPRFRELKGIEQFQIIQPDINNITLKIVKNKLFSPEELEKMIQMIKEKIGKGVKISVEECSHIPLTERGKTRLVISNLPTEF
jgi:phenylacetate-CoA ligase